MRYLVRSSRCSASTETGRQHLHCGFDRRAIVLFGSVGSFWDIGVSKACAQFGKNIGHNAINRWSFVDPSILKRDDLGNGRLLSVLGLLLTSATIYDIIS